MTKELIVDSLVSSIAGRDDGSGQHYCA